MSANIIGLVNDSAAAVRHDSVLTAAEVKRQLLDGISANHGVIYTQGDVWLVGALALLALIVAGLLVWGIVELVN